MNTHGPLKDTMEPKEAEITINGVKLSFAQSCTVRVAISSWLSSLNDPNGEELEALGEIGVLYQKRLREIQTMIFLNLN